MRFLFYRLYAPGNFSKSKIFLRKKCQIFVQNEWEIGASPTGCPKIMYTQIQEFLKFKKFPKFAREIQLAA